MFLRAKSWTEMFCALAACETWAVVFIWGESLGPVVGDMRCRLGRLFRRSLGSSLSETWAVGCFRGSPLRAVGIQLSGILADVCIRGGPLGALGVHLLPIWAVVCIGRSTRSTRRSRRTRRLWRSSRKQEDEEGRVKINNPTSIFQCE